MVNSLLRATAAFVLITLMPATHAADPVSWKFALVENTSGTIEVQLVAIVESGWHIYALELPRDDGPLPTVIDFPSMEGYTVVSIVEPTPEEVMDPNFAMLVRYHSGKPVFIATLERHSNKAFTLHGELEFMACNDITCLPPVTVPFQLDVPARTQ